MPRVIDCTWTSDRPVITTKYSAIELRCSTCRTRRSCAFLSRAASTIARAFSSEFTRWRNLLFYFCDAIWYASGGSAPLVHRVPFDAVDNIAGDEITDRLAL